MINTSREKMKISQEQVHWFFSKNNKIIITK
jgi:hypothetical protein